ncbi:MAG: PTS sugar transporter subunit IIB [Lactovum sp.]
MIIHARVDERLVHGQVAAVWTNILRADRLYIVNDNAWQDDIVKGALSLAKPAGKKMTISSIRRAIINFRNKKYENERIFVITKNIADMKTLVEAEIGLEEFNVGNLSGHDDSVQIKKSVSLSSQDIKDLKELLDKQIKITAQMVPGESDQSIQVYLEK